MCFPAYLHKCCCLKKCNEKQCGIELMLKSIFSHLSLILPGGEDHTMLHFCGSCQGLRAGVGHPLGVCVSVCVPLATEPLRKPLTRNCQTFKNTKKKKSWAYLNIHKCFSVNQNQNQL